MHACLTLCEPMDCSPPGSSVHGILRARIPGEFWGGVPCPPPGELPNGGITSPALEGVFLPLAPPGKPKKVIEGAILDKRGEKDLSDEVREEHSKESKQLVQRSRGRRLFRVCVHESARELVWLKQGENRRDTS